MQISTKRFLPRLAPALLLALPYLAVSQTSVSAPASSPLLAASAPTAVPALVPYSGVVAVTDAKTQAEEATVTFLIFKEEAGGEPLFTETQSVIVDATGHFKVQLGASNPNGLPGDLFASGEARWLEVQVAGQTPQPRVLLASVPYALKASDAATLGGLPASAFALVGQAAGTIVNSAGVTPGVTSNVTTTGGTAGYIPEFSGAASIVNSPVFVLGSNIGIGTTTPTAPLDVTGATMLNGPLTVNGNSTYNGSLVLPAMGTATAAKSYYSQFIKIQTSAWNSATASVVSPRFQWVAETAGNNTATPTATLNLQSSMTTNPPTETGFYFNPDGTLHFATGQTFPGVAQLSNNTFVGNQTVTGNVTANDSSSATNASGIVGNENAATGMVFGVSGNAKSSTNFSAGVNGTESALTGQVYGTSGTAASSTNYAAGLGGLETAKTGVVFGVTGTASSVTNGASGVQGTENASKGAVFGVSGNASSVTNGAAGVNGNESAATGQVYGVYGSANSTSGAGVFGYESAATGQVSGVNGYIVSTTNYSGAVSGYEGATTGAVYGVTGGTASTGDGAAAVNGYESGATGYVFGVSGSAASSTVNASGVIGRENAATGQVYGVTGITNSAGNLAAGVQGYEGAATGQVYGVIGDAVSTTGIGVYGNEEAVTGIVFGVFGGAFSTTNGAAAIEGYESATAGQVFGVSGTSASATNGAVGVIGNEAAVTGQVYGVSGIANSTTTGAAGVNGVNGAASGQVYGVSGSISSNTEYAAAVNGFASASTGQVYGVSGSTTSNSGFGVNGVATATDGAAYGVVGTTASPDGFGVYGIHNSSGYGLAANNALAGTGVSLGGPSLLIYGYKLGEKLFTVDSSGNGFFAGNLQVTGNVSKGGGSFKIDHPLDPANKYLSHSFVESPDMMDVYNGNITTDKRGLATVLLPDYFEALNRDFRYQLTVMGQFAQAIVAREIDKNHFIIRTSKPGVKVSWQVTGIRQDAYANANRIPTEEEKPAAEQGYYLHPEVFGQPADKSVAAIAKQSGSRGNSTR